MFGLQCQIEHLAPALGVPAPFDLVPQEIDAAAQAPFLGRVAIEILPGAEEALEEKRRLDQIRGIILAPEGNGGPGHAIHEMRIDAVIAGCDLEHVEHAGEAFERCLARHPLALDGDDHGHDAETGAARGDLVVLRIGGREIPVARQEAHRMSAFPEKAEGPALHGFEQSVIREPGIRPGGLPGFERARYVHRTGSEKRALGLMSGIFLRGARRCASGTFSRWRTRLKI